MRYGFAIDQRTCIGCHACTVACKTEHDIPLGQFRTWVKYVERGEFPATTRDFGVLRCNHCTDAPCVTICPTGSLFKRDDGIVDFDRDRCIGCKSCMQACPYDAIYIDEATHTAAKCNFCAHRVDQGLEPACVVVCPTESIWVGDLDDPDSAIARLVASEPTAVRSPEQGTGPNVFYLGADPAVLDPLAAPVGTSYLWARPDEQRRRVADVLPVEPAPGAERAVTTLNTAHPRPWGWRVTTYLWTKGVGAGALLVVAGAPLAGAELGTLERLVAPALAVGFTGTTAGLLVWDLKQPARALYIFTRANPTSWLFWGSVALAGYSAVAGGWLAVGVAESAGWLDPVAAAALRRVLRPPAAAGGVLAAGYTAFLFGQAEGRDLWQSPLLFWHLLVQAVTAGSGALLVAAAATRLAPRPARVLVRTFVAAGAVQAGLAVAEHTRRHPTRAARAAAHLVTRGRYRRLFWGGAVGGGLAAAACALPAWRGRRMAAAAVGGVLAQGALLAYESVFVRAGQDLPLS